MDKDNKILVSAILIIGIAIFASSLNTGISGRAVSCEVPTATVSPTSGVASTDFVINIEGDFSNKINIVRSNGGIADEYRNACKDNTCDGGIVQVKTFSQELSDTWTPGKYCPKVRDLCTKDSSGLRDRVVLQGGCFYIVAN